MTKLEQIAQQIESQKLPPVDKWKPKHQGEIDIEIDVQGQWFHEGQRISRDKLVALFSTILWHEDNKYYLVTPAEKLLIQVGDVPYIIHQAELADGTWVATTNTHEQVIIGDQHQVELRQFQGQWIPYVNIRFDLWARVNRSIFYQWVELAIEEAETDPLELHSGNYAFEVAKA